ncbi:unnamed protein product [Brachionus calyciflorus]|uniref:Uncharacterized protein n=1 Tax=Brachionus calyciflorus TaxID=104777 RepID=A0A813S9C6_9BILA|nr:unnamed protein product [Brachionus calyciflorus]
MFDDSIREEDSSKNEERFKKVKASLITKYLAEKLKKEQELVKYNNYILNTKYLSIKRKEKSEEILQNIDDFKKIAKNFLEFKSKIELIFEKSFKDDADLNLFVFTDSIFIKDKLIENFLRNIFLLKEDFIKRVDEIKNDFENDKAKIEQNYLEHIKTLNEQIMAIEADFYFFNQEDEKNLNKTKDSINCEHLDQIVTLKVDMGRKIRNLHGTFSETKKYIDREMNFLTKPEEIMAKNEKIELEMQKDRNKIKSLIEKCKSLEDEINLVNVDFLLKNKKIAVHDKYKQYSFLNQEFNTKKKEIHNQILKVVIESTAASEKLKSNLDKCKKILSFFDFCRKLETPEEKNTPFCKTNLEQSPIENIWSEFVESNEKAKSTFVENLFDEEFKNKDYNFYVKYAKVNIEFESLKQVKSDLERENLNLKLTLKKYISSLEINCHV